MRIPDLTAYLTYLPILTVPLAGISIGCSEVAASPLRGTVAWCSVGSPNVRTAVSGVKPSGGPNWIVPFTVPPAGTSPLGMKPWREGPFQTTFIHLPSELTLFELVLVLRNDAVMSSFRCMESYVAPLMSMA